MADKTKCQLCPSEQKKFDDALKAYLERLKKELVGEPHILNPFNFPRP